MMKFNTIVYFLITLFFINLNSADAQIDSIKNTDSSLNGQYQFMLSRSRNSYGSKLINPVRLNALWKSVTDTLNKERKELKAIKAKLTAQAGNISTLKAEVSGKENSLADSEAMLNEISFLGISFTKTTYNVMVWSIISILAAGLAIVIFSTSRYKTEAVYRTELYQEIADEFQAYKVKAKDKEMKLARELQDERNKWDDANGY